MQIVVSQCTRLARIYIEYLDVQHRQVISACTAAEGDVWCVLPLFLHFIRIRKIHQGSRPTTVCHLFRCFDEPLIECPDIGGFGWRCQVAMMESDSLLAPLDATLSACWLRCGQPLPIPTDQQHVAAICVALTWKNCFATSTVGYLCSCRLLMPTGLLILYLVDVTWITWCNIPWMSDLISFIWQCIS